MRITPDAFPEYSDNTRLNDPLIQEVSVILAQNHTFKVQNIDFSTFSEAGSEIQAMITRPSPTNNIREKNDELYTSTIIEENGTAVRARRGKVNYGGGSAMRSIQKITNYM